MVICTYIHTHHGSRSEASLGGACSLSHAALLQFLQALFIAWRCAPGRARHTSSTTLGETPSQPGMQASLQARACVAWHLYIERACGLVAAGEREELRVHRRNRLRPVDYPSGIPCRRTMVAVPRHALPASGQCGSWRSLLGTTDEGPGVVRGRTNSGSKGRVCVYAGALSQQLFARQQANLVLTGTHVLRAR